MLSPDSMVTVVLLLVVGLAAVVGVARLGARPWALAAAVPAVLAPLLAGALWVNVAYDYYQGWGDAFADLSGRPLTAAAAPPLPSRPASGSPTPAAAPSVAPVSTRPGRLVTLQLAGSASGLSRPAVVWLPGAYDEPGQAGRRFPVLMLMHGDPGEPAGFIYGMHLDAVADGLVRSGQMPPYVVVMPTVWEGWHGQQCLDSTTGPADETYLTRDVPAALRAQLRVEPPGPRWVLAGLSEGGYCAADLALRHPTLFRGAAALDGYFSPSTRRGVGYRLFGGNAQAERAADPLRVVAAWSGRPAPALWLMYGDADGEDVRQAEAFAAAAVPVTAVRTVLVRGGRHTTPSWRAALPDLLTWTGTLLAGKPAPRGPLALHVS